jgi:hypothetical protein
MWRDTRGRLTIPDVVFLLAALAFGAPLVVVFVDGMEANAGILTTGELYLYQLLVPGTVLVMLAVVFRKAVQGGS